MEIHYLNALKFWDPPLHSQGHKHSSFVTIIYTMKLKNNYFFWLYTLYTLDLLKTLKEINDETENFWIVWYFELF